MIDHADLSLTTWPPAPRVGRNAGTSSHGVKITHLPTGASVVCNEYRNQANNITLAMDMLRAKLESPT